jgi:hypothetical protein
MARQSSGVASTMTSIPSSSLPVVLSLEPGPVASQREPSMNADGVFTIAITVPADKDHGHLSWDELIGKR